MDLLIGEMLQPETEELLVAHDLPILALEALSRLALLVARVAGAQAFAGRAANDRYGIDYRAALNEDQVRLGRTDLALSQFMH